MRLTAASERCWAALLAQVGRATGWPTTTTSPIDLAGWFEREEAHAGPVQSGGVDCRDEMHLQMLFEAFEASTAFAGLVCMRPPVIAAGYEAAYRLQAKLERLTGRPRYHLMMPLFHIHLSMEA